MKLSPADLEELQGKLSSSLPWSPLDFIRELSSEGDRHLYAAQLMSELDDESDLRLVGSLESGQRAVVIAEKLQWDSDFFGYGVAKLSGVFMLEEPYYQTVQDYSSLLKAVLATAKEKGVRYFFASVDPRDLALLRTLGELGFSLIETRLYYHMDLRDYHAEKRHSVRAATVADIPSLGTAAQVMVNPFDRFHADPFISDSQANQLMYRWVDASIRDNFADVTIVPADPNPTAFCTVKYHKDKWPIWKLNLAQPVFSAVSSEYRGWYRKLISEINYHLRQVDAQHSFLVTQVTNKAVLRVWESLGYRFGKGEHIFRKLI